MTDDFGSAADLWRAKEPSRTVWCPNVSLFRFLGNVGLSLDGATVLEIGFGGNAGADLRHCASLGSRAFGTDINDKFVDYVSVQANFECRLATQIAGQEPIPFDEHFDLIYSRDTIYYLTDAELAFFAHDARTNLAPGGLLVVQFIECDLVSDGVQVDEQFEKNNFAEFRRVSHAEPANPIRHLNARQLVALFEASGFRLTGNKWQVQTYDRWGEAFRVDRYLAFEATT